MRSLRVKIVTYFCALSLAFQSKGEAWPTEMRGCGLDAHPSTARGGHGTPQSTNSKDESPPAIPLGDVIESLIELNTFH